MRVGICHVVTAESHSQHVILTLLLPLLLHSSHIDGITCQLVLVSDSW